MDFSRLHRAIFNRPVFWSAVCRGCVRGNIQSESGLYCGVIFLGARRRLSNIHFTSSFFGANKMQIKSNIPAAGGTSRLAILSLAFVTLRIARFRIFAVDLWQV